MLQPRPNEQPFDTKDYKFIATELCTWSYSTHQCHIEMAELRKTEQGSQKTDIEIIQDMIDIVQEATGVKPIVNVIHQTKE